MRKDCDQYVAAVMTVRNERDLLSANIAFHRFSGIDLFYIYLDDRQDNSASDIRHIHNIKVLNSTLPQWLTQNEVEDANRLIGRYRTHHTARQIINCHDAIKRARADGASWLVSIDPDELILVDDKDIEFGTIAMKLNSLPCHVESVTFPTTEVIPTKICYANIFREANLFKSRYGYGEGIRFNEMTPPSRAEWNPSRISRIELRRKLMSIGFKWPNLPEQDEYIQHLDTPVIALNGKMYGKQEYLSVSDWYIGHVIGKQAFRVDRDIHFNSLHTVRTSTKIASACFGRLLHYNCYSFDKFVSKYLSFRNHPNSYAKGSPVDETKLFLRDFVNKNYGHSMKKLLNLYMSQLCFQKNRILPTRDLWPIAVQEIHFVSELFKRNIVAPYTFA